MLRRLPDAPLHAPQLRAETKVTDTLAPDVFSVPRGPFVTRIHRWAFVLALVEELHVHLTELRAAHINTAAGSLFDALDVFMTEQTSEDLHLSQAEIAAAERAGVIFGDPEEEEEIHWDCWCDECLAQRNQALSWS